MLVTKSRAQMHRLLDTLKRHEGYRRHPYADTTGHTTIGYGRNLDAVGLTELEAEYLLEHDLQVALDACYTTVPRWRYLEPARAEALANMMLNLGRPRFVKFQKMLRAVAAGDWDRAAAEALDSKWAKQVGRRADEIAAALKYGEWVV